MGNVNSEARQTRSFILYSYLQQSQELKDANVIIPDHIGETTRFRAIYPPDRQFMAVSCSVPSDGLGNDGTTPSTLETALIGHEGDLIYIDDLGYSDVCKFSSNEEVLEELLRLAPRLGG
jgi:hypothetical protein